jgi:hypothetical protein
MKTTLAGKATDAEWIHCDTVFEENLECVNRQHLVK